MTLDEIYYNEDIEVRAINVCRYSGLLNLELILNHYFRYKTFKNLKNCGKKSNNELIGLCLKYNYLTKENNDEIKQKEKKLINLIADFNKTKRDIINSYIENNLKNLSIRSLNVLSAYLNKDFKIKNVSEKILSIDQFNFKNLKNAGEKSINELNYFTKILIEFVYEISSLDNETDLIDFKNKYFFEKIFKINLTKNHLVNYNSIFSVINFAISNNLIFGKHENLIFEKAFKIFNSQNLLTIDTIAEEINISRERVRQLRNSILEKLFNYLQFSKNIQDDLETKYGLNLNNNYIIIDDDLCNSINETSKTNFTREFLTYMIYVYCSDQYSLIGKLEDILIEKNYNSRDRYNWKNFYLVQKDFINTLDFQLFANDVDFRLNERIEETYFFNFKSYLHNFMISHDIVKVNDIFDLAEKILNIEFEKSIDLEENIIFNRNTNKQVPEFAIEALEKIGIPSNIEDIYRLIEKDYPEITKSKEALRGSLQRTPEIIYFGRSSTYGLKKWETEKEGIKGGTIRSIVINFLELETEPIHISKISKHVLQYRPDSNEKSIYYNLKMDESNSFIFFKDSYVGLIQKNYDKAFEQITNDNRIEKKSWEERYTELSGFIAVNNRLPFSSGCPENERKLYRWYKIQVGKTKNGGIEEEKSNLINEIIKNFEKVESTQRTSTSNIGRRKKVSGNSNYTFEDLTKFISINKRMPDSRDPNESSLYQFYHRNKKNLENIDALSAQNVKLLELIEKFGSSKHPKYTIDQLMEFIKINKRMPDSRETNERGLYQFLYKQRKLFEQGKLEQSEENQFIEIAKIIQNYKYEN